MNSAKYYEPMKKSLVIILLLLALAVHVSDVTAQGWTFEDKIWRDPNGYSCFGGYCGWTDTTWETWSKMRDLGFSSNLATDIINECKKSARDPAHCVRTATFIAVAESTAGNNAKKNNVFGIQEGDFATKKEAVDDWISRYNRKWYKTT